MTGIFAAVPLDVRVEARRARASFAHLANALASLEPTFDLATRFTHRQALCGIVRPAGVHLSSRFVEDSESGDALLYLGDGRTDERTLRRVLDSRDYAELSGFFAAIVLDGARRDGRSAAMRCTLVRDRSGSIPLAYRVLDGMLYVAPRVMALHPVRPSLDELDPLGLGFLLSSGYIPGAATQFTSIRSVEPGTAVNFARREAPSVRRYWRYPPSTSNNAVDTVDLLERAVAAFDASVAANYPDAPHCAVFLSGGIDSRAIVAGCVARTGRAADVHTVSWGESDSVPGSDAFVAREVASAFGTRHRFLPKRCLDFAGDFAMACRSTDWLSDVPFMQPVEWRLMRALADDGYRSCLRGDQVFSGNRAVHDTRDAQSMATLYRLRHQRLANRLLRAGVHDRWSEATEAFLLSLDVPEGHSPSDLRDLYRFEHEVANLHQVSALYKSRYMDHRNPILDDHLLGILPATRSDDRTGKRLFRQVEARVAARAAAIPFAERHSDPDSELFFAEGGIAREYLLDSLDDASSPVFELFDRTALLDVATRDLPRRRSPGSAERLRKRFKGTAIDVLCRTSPRLAGHLSHRSRASSLPWHKGIGRFLLIKHFMDSHFRT